MESYLETIEFTDALDFLDYLQLRNPRWLPPKATSTPWVFRGQYGADLGLLPSALRPNQLWFNKFKKLYRSEVSDYVYSKKIEYKFDEFQPEKDRLIELILQIVAEWNSVEEFIDLANQVGHQIPADDVVYIEPDAKIDWKQVADTFTKTMKHHDYDYWDPERIKFALAQHHGIPTRLLDWTHSPIVAAVFAIEGANADSQPESKIVVWAINYTLLEHTSLKVITHKRSKIPFLHAQSGLFIYDSIANLKFLQNGYWSGIEQVFVPQVDKANNSILRKVTLVSSQANELLRLLTVEGVTRAHLMPTLDNITKTLETRHRLSND